MASVQTIVLPQHLAPLLRVEDSAGRHRSCRDSIAVPKPTRKTGTVRTRLTLPGISKISNIELVNWVRLHTADDRHLRPSVFEGSHDA